MKQRPLKNIAMAFVLIGSEEISSTIVFCVQIKMNCKCVHIIVLSAKLEHDWTNSIDLFSNSLQKN